jgi:hypothetical protein
MNEVENGLDALEALVRQGRTDEALAKIALLKQLVALQAKSEALNPVTVRGTLTRHGKDPINLTLGRLWLAEKDFSPPDIKIGTLSKLWEKGHQQAQEGQEKGVQKCFTAVMWCGPDKHPQPLATGVFEEDKIIESLNLLFPKGELVSPKLMLFMALKGMGL